MKNKNLSAHLRYTFLFQIYCNLGLLGNLQIEQKNIIKLKAFITYSTNAFKSDFKIMFPEKNHSLVNIKFLVLANPI